MKPLPILGCTMALITYADLAVAKSMAEVETIARATTLKISLLKNKNFGSGVVIHRQGPVYTIVTNRHVVCGGSWCDRLPEDETYTLGLPSGQSIKVKPTAIKFLGTDLDLATIQFRSQSNYTVATIATNPVKVTEQIYTAGFPFEQPKFTFGAGETFAVASQRLKGDRGGYGIIYDARTLPGMSGSGVFNQQGQLVAIHGVGDRFAKGNSFSNYRIGSKTGFNRGISASLLVQSLAQAGINFKTPVNLSPLSRGNSATRLTADDYFILGFNKLVDPGPDAEAGQLQAIQEFSRAIQLNPNYEMAYFMRAVTYEELREYLKALQDYDRTIEIDPKDADNYYVRAVHKIESPNIRDYRGALIDLNRAIALNPRYTRAYIQRGTLKYEKLKDFKGALADLNQAISISPRSVSAYQERASLKRELEDFRGALADYDRAIKINPKSADTHFNRAGLRLKLKDRAGAIQDYRQAARLYRERGNSKYANFAVQVLESIGAKE
jgi:Tfp pilus assembly protein PilF